MTQPPWRKQMPITPPNPQTLSAITAFTPTQLASAEAKTRFVNKFLKFLTE